MIRPATTKIELAEKQQAVTCGGLAAIVELIKTLGLQSVGGSGDPIGRIKLQNIDGFGLKEPRSPYNRAFDPEKCSLRLKNDHIWEVS